MPGIPQILDVFGVFEKIDGAKSNLSRGITVSGWSLGKSYFVRLKLRASADWYHVITDAQGVGSGDERETPTAPSALGVLFFFWRAEPSLGGTAHFGACRRRLRMTAAPNPGTT